MIRGNPGLIKHHFLEAPSDTEATIIDFLKLDNPLQASRKLDRPNIYLSAPPIRGLGIRFHAPWLEWCDNMI